jgi:hypothetical protein
VNIQILIVVLAAGLLILGFMAIAVKPGGRKPARGSGRSRSYAPTLDRADIRARWDQIIAVSQTGGSGLKSSVLDADKLLDHVLKSQGFRGETMGDRLRSAGSRFSNRNNVWRAHKLRNTMAHELGFDLVPSQVREALSDFEQALRDLGAL